MELNIRKSWDLLNLGEYIEYLDILACTGTTVLTKHIEILALLCDVPSDKLRSLPAGEVISLFSALDFLKEEPKGNLKRAYDLDGRKYALCERIDKITTGQFIDLSEYCKDKDNLIRNSANVIATLILPIIEEQPIITNGAQFKRKDPLTEEYLKTPREETVQAILNHMPVTEALSICSFFTYLWLTYTLGTRESSRAESNQSK